MARVQKDVVNYFPHDANACGGDTLTVLQSQFGNDGYAFWFKLLEKLASTDGHFIDCRNSTKWQLLLAKTGVNEITGVEIMKLLVEMQAIDKDLWESKLIWCQKLVDNIADVYKNRRREIPQKPILTAENPITTDDNALTTGRGTQSKVNESKVNNIVDNNNIIEELQSLSQWGDTHSLEDAQWLLEFLAEYPDLTSSHIKGCRDFHSNKTKHTKALWKTRLRNWMKKDREFQKGGQGGTYKQRPRKLPDQYTRPEDLGPRS